MSTRSRPRVRRWIPGSGPDNGPGAKIHSGPVFVVIPARHLRDVADALHDLADTFENPHSGKDTPS